MTDYAKYENGHLVSASLRGLTENILLEKKDLSVPVYASIYKELCERCGIQCDYIRGIAYADPLRNGKPGGHAWNVVNTDDGLIPVDVTWRASSGGRKDWFGASKNFDAQHVSDIDELYKEFSDMLPSIMFDSDVNKLNFVLNTLTEKYGSREESIKILQTYLETNEPSKITRTDNARKIVMSLKACMICNSIMLSRFKKFKIYI